MLGAVHGVLGTLKLWMVLHFLEGMCSLLADMEMRRIVTDSSLCTLTGLQLCGLWGVFDFMNEERGRNYKESVISMCPLPTVHAAIVTYTLTINVMC